MADTKISALTALTGANVATDDEFVIVDTSATETKNITIAEHLLYLTSALPFAVDTVTATDATYTLENTLQAIVLDDATDSVNIALTFDAVISVGSVVVIGALDGGATGHTVTLGGSQTYDGTNNIATFDAANEAIVIIGISSTRVLVMSNVGSVAFST